MMLYDSVSILLSAVYLVICLFLRTVYIVVAILVLYTAVFYFTGMLGSNPGHFTYEAGVLPLIYCLSHSLPPPPIVA